MGLENSFGVDRKFSFVSSPLLDENLWEVKPCS